DVMKSRKIPGKPYARALYEAGLETNFNSIPNDPRKPFSPSGLRIGTPAVTTRGFKEPQMVQIADWMDRVAAACTIVPTRNKEGKEIKDYRFDEAVLRRLRGEVHDLCTGGQFPVP